MEIIRNCFSSFRISFFMIILLITSSPASSQISTPCTNTLLSSFTPCLNYLTGSTNGGGSPTSDCCDSLGSLISSSAECACMIITGNVPIPINRALAISLPKICNSKSVPLQCKSKLYFCYYIYIFFGFDKPLLLKIKRNNNALTFTSIFVNIFL